MPASGTGIEVDKNTWEAYAKQVPQYYGQIRLQFAFTIHYDDL